MCVRGLHICSLCLRDLNRALLIWSADPNSSDLATLVLSRNLTLDLISSIKSALAFLRQKEGLGHLMESHRMFSTLISFWVLEDLSRWYVKPEKDNRVAHEIDLYEGFQHPAFPTASVTLSFLNTTVLRAHLLCEDKCHLAWVGREHFQGLSVLSALGALLFVKHSPPSIVCDSFCFDFFMKNWISNNFSIITLLLGLSCLLIFTHWEILDI